jgi:hypothetical protein
MKRLIGVAALATVVLSYSAQAKGVVPEPEPIPEAEATGIFPGMDAKDHPGYGGVTPDPGYVYGPTLVWTGDAKDHPGYGAVIVAEHPTHGCLGSDYDVVCHA